MLESNIETIEITSCRLCGGHDFYTLFTLGDQYINDFVTFDRIGAGRKAPLEMVRCPSCKLVQLRHNAPQELLYSRQYWYRSGVTQTMRDGLKEIANLAIDVANIAPGDIILDIGANDGTFLKNFLNQGFLTVGCEPADNLVSELSENCDAVIHDFWSEAAFRGAIGERKAKIITALGMFYDLEHPLQFVQDIASVLHDDGVFISQLMTLEPMLRKNDLGNICHEHLEYYCFDSLRYLFEQSGLEIFRVEENDINGGSLRLFARKFKTGSIERTENTSDVEIMKFKERIDINRRKTLDFISQARLDGKIVHIYGASTKGNVILQYYGLDSQFIPFASERSPEKFGRFTIGSWIPIIPEGVSRQLNPDYYFVLPYGFYKEMRSREKDFVARGGKFILCTPEFIVE